MKGVVRNRHRLYVRRIELGLSQAGLAKLVGVKQATIGNWERGQAVPKDVLLTLKYAKVLQMSPSEVIKILMEEKKVHDFQRVPGSRPEDPEP